MDGPMGGRPGTETLPSTQCGVKRKRGVDFRTATLLMRLMNESPDSFFHWPKIEACLSAIQILGHCLQLHYLRQQDI